MKARLFLSPLDGVMAEIAIDQPVRISDLIGDADVVEWFSDGGCVRLDGHVIPPQNWRAITLKPHAAAVVELIYVPQGKKTLVLLATVAVTALAAAVSGGLLGPAALGIFGSAFAAGGLGASLAGAAIGLAGSLAIAALTAPPKQNEQGGGDARQFSEAGVSANQISLFEPLPVIFGKIAYSPPLLAPAYTSFDGDAMTAHAVVGVHGRCRIEGVKINGLPSADIPGLVMETLEGGPGDVARSMFLKTVIEERDSVALSTFKTVGAATSSDALEDQVNPDNSTPDWHVFRTAGEWDEVVLRMLFPSGIAFVPTGSPGMVALRVEVRRVGDVAWRRLPTFHFQDLKSGAGPVRAEIRLERRKQPGGFHVCTAKDDYAIFEVNNHTALGQSFAYQADAYFTGGVATNNFYSNNTMLPVFAGPTAGGITISTSSNQAGREGWRACDSDIALGGGSYWAPINNSLPAWFKVSFAAATVVRSYVIAQVHPTTGESDTFTPQEWFVEGSLDDLNWVPLDDGNIIMHGPQFGMGTFQIGAPAPYTHYRWTFVRNNGAANNELHINSFRLHDHDADGQTFGPDLIAHGGKVAVHSTKAARCRYASIDKRGCRIFLDPGQWPAGEYEIRLKRSAAMNNPFMNIAGLYEYNGNPANTDFFERRLVGGKHVIFMPQNDYRSDAVVEAFQTISADAPFDGNGLALIAVTVPNLQISAITAEFTRYAPIYVGGIWNAAEVPTQNPAALYRQLLLGGANARPVAGENIDEAGLIAWYQQCAAQGHQANAVLQGVRVAEAKQILATAGYASPRDSDLFGVVEDRDTSAEPVRHAISPLNSADEGTSSALPDVPDAIRAEFNDEAQGYAVDHVMVYRDGMTAADARIFETISYPGFTDVAKVTARAQFDMRQAVLRQVRYRRRMGLDGFTLRRGDLVGLGDDVIDGDTAAGWISAVGVNAGMIESITLDNIMPWSAAGEIELADDIDAIVDVVNPASPMGVAIRIPGQPLLLKQVSNITDSNVCTFTTPFADDGSITADLLVIAGQWSRVVRRCKVMAVIPQGFEERIVELADEAPDLFA